MAHNSLEELKDFLSSEECNQELPILPYQLLEAITLLEEKIDAPKDQ